MKRIKTVILFIIVCGTFLQAENKRPFTIDDYFKTQDISDIRISPDGDNVVFVKQEIIDDRSAKGKMKRKRDIYMVTLADNEIHRLTSHEKDSSMPRWSSDGRYLFFLSSRSGKSQIWMLDMKRGGEGQQLTNWDPGIEEYACSPDSEYIAFVSKDPKKKKDADDEEKDKKDDPYVITRTRYLYDGSGYFGDPREWHHLWVISLSDPKNPRKITDGNFDDRNCEWSPDGQHIVFVSNRTGDDDNNDNFSSFGVDDTAYWYEKDFGLPYDEKNFTQYRKTSPILYIKNCTTPILIMQCMEDHRCPLPQALQFYMGLKKLKKAETQLILYPREPHGIREIPHQSDRLQRIVSWFDLYLKK